MREIIITKNQKDRRLDRFLKKYFEKSTLSFIYKMIRKDIKVNNKRVKNDYVLKEGDVVSVFLDDETIDNLKRNRQITQVGKQFKVAYEDKNILIADKPYGLLTHGDKTEKKNHLTNQVIDYLIAKGDYNPAGETTFVPAPVNRLDRNTTGLVIFGKTGEALQEMSKLIRERGNISKKYLTIVFGAVKEELHLVNYMTKDENKNLVTVYKNPGDNEREMKLMETHAKPLGQGQYKGETFTLMEVEIITGRTHQIRAQLASGNHPIIGDIKYGNKKLNLWSKRNLKNSTQILHAYKLEFSGDIEGLFSYLGGKTVEAQLPKGFLILKELIFKGDGSNKNA